MKKILWISQHPTHYWCLAFSRFTETLDLRIDNFVLKDVNKLYPWQEIRSYGFNWSILSFTNIYLLKKFLRSFLKADYVVLSGWNYVKILVVFLVSNLFLKNIVFISDTPRNPGFTFSDKLRLLILRLMLRNVKAVLVTGEIGVEKFREYGLKCDTYNFPFLVDLDFFHPRFDFVSNNDRPIVIFSSGRLDIAHKGYDIAFHALAQLKGYFDFVYKIAGSGPDLRTLQELAMSLGIQENIEFIGWLEMEQLVLNYQQADIFLHPSNFDPFPNAVLEAMACGCLVVASSAAGSAVDRIVHQQNGFIFKSGDTQSLRDNLVLSLKLNSDDLKVIKNNSRLTAERFNYMFNCDVLKKVLEL